MLNFPVYRNHKMDLSDRVRWLVQDVHNIEMEFATHGSRMNINLLNNLQKMIDMIKINMEIVNE